MSQVEEVIKSYLPMTEASFLLLASLTEENHGYGIMQKVGYMTGTRVSLGAGTVYTILNKMENDDLIQVTREVERRKLYLITPLGMEVLRAECRRLHQLCEIADYLTKQFTAGLPAAVTV